MKSVLPFLVLLLLLPSACGSRAVGGLDQPPILTTDQWRADLRHYAQEMPRRHKNLFHSMAQAEFERLVRELDVAIPTLESHQVIVRLQQITARVGDAHTNVQMPAWFELYPLSLYWFGDTLRVVGTAKEYERALGTRVVQIGELPIAEADARIRTCFPSVRNENEWYALATSPAFLIRPEVLHGLGIIADRASATFTFEDDQGTRFQLELKPTAAPRRERGRLPTIAGMVLLSPQPLFRQRPTETFWFTFLPDSTLYVSWRGYDALGDHARDLFEAIERQPVRRLVVDLRQNGGGDFIEGRERMVEPIRKRTELNQEGRLFVIVGRRTFSAALANAVDFRKTTHATLVGEPIGERPNSYAENDEFTLPNSRVVVSYSTRYYEFVDRDVPAVEPDVRIDPSWPAWKAGRDPVMDWITTRRW